MPFTYQILLEPQQIGVELAEPAVVREVMFHGSGGATAGTPILRIALGDREYELRLRFQCWVTVRVASGERVERHALLASGVAEGEDLPGGFRYCDAQLISSQGIPKSDR